MAATKACHGCGNAVRSGAKFCGRCGQYRPTAVLTGDRLLIILLVIVAALSLLLAQKISVI
jgi:RNA polymerase subunit RPABC4/transcription elongation factor Spt4